MQSSGLRHRALMLHGDARVLDPPEQVDLVLTSPPYPGLIDYHEQHVYAFELLGLERKDEAEIGRSVRGYCEGVSAVLDRAAKALRPGGRIVIVVNDRRELYGSILSDAGLQLEDRVVRHVNRRTGRRNGEYFEEILVARPSVVDGEPLSGRLAASDVSPGGRTWPARCPSSSIFPCAASSFATHTR